MSRKCLNYDREKDDSSICVEDVKPVLQKGLLKI